MIGVAAGFRIGPESSAVTVLGRSQKQEHQRSSARMWMNPRLIHDLRGSSRPVDNSRRYTRRDEAESGRDGYDRGQVADQLTSGSPPRFAHESEAELARILDFYGVAWRYEPDVFPISWNADGAVIESFAPDFYLPEIDLYLELTTLKQSLVRKKNRKLRHLRQLYPEIRVKLFYARDFRALMVKYGRLDFLTGVATANGIQNGIQNGNGNGHANGNPIVKARTDDAHQ
jgi:hypothetical protein